MVTLLGGLSRRFHGDYRSSAVDPPNGAASFVPVTITVASAWVISVYPAEDGLLTGQS